MTGCLCIVYSAVLSDVKDTFQECETIQIITGLDSCVTAATVMLGVRYIPAISSFSMRNFLLCVQINDFREMASSYANISPRSLCYDITTHKFPIQKRNFEATGRK